MRHYFFMILFTISSMVWSMEYKEEKILATENEDQFICTTFDVEEYADEQGQIFKEGLKNAGIEPHQVITEDWGRLITRSLDKQHYVWENRGGIGSRSPTTLYWGKLEMGLWLNYIIKSAYPILENHEQCTVVHPFLDGRDTPPKERTLVFINDSHFLYHIESKTYEIILKKIIWNDKKRDDIENMQ